MNSKYYDFREPYAKYLETTGSFYSYILAIRSRLRQKDVKVVYLRLN